LITQGDCNNSIKITIITVVYNDQAGIEATLKSVLGQTYKNVEYIVIDAMSNDRTEFIIHKYINGISAYIREADRGIYDGMNKGISFSTGDWLLFMNSGDTFYTETIITKLVETLQLHRNDDLSVIYGDSRRVNADGSSSIIEASPKAKFNKGSFFSHQSALIKGDVHRRKPYNLKYKLASDFDFFYQVHRESGCFMYIPIVFSNFLSAGVSDTNRVAVIKEFWLIVNSGAKESMYFCTRIVVEYIKLKLKTIINKILLNES
jgi:glycosyltransferase involved in cell wall biosynthesis